jgi:hypothetical protein
MALNGGEESERWAQNVDVAGKKGVSRIARAKL